MKSWKCGQFQWKHKPSIGPSTHVHGCTSPPHTRVHIVYTHEHICEHICTYTYLCVHKRTCAHIHSNIHTHIHSPEWIWTYKSEREGGKGQSIEERIFQENSVFSSKNPESSGSEVCLYYILFHWYMSVFVLVSYCFDDCNLIPLLGIWPEKTNLKRYIHPYVHSSTIYSSQTWKQPKCPLTEEWVKKTWYIYAMEYYSAI